MSDRPDVNEQQLTREDFLTLPIERLAGVTGLTPPPAEAGDAQREAWRLKAFRSYELDLENRSEWGTATQATEVPDAGPDA
jgi:hypothetical protein